MLKFMFSEIEHLLSGRLKHEVFTYLDGFGRTGIGEVLAFLQRSQYKKTSKVLSYSPVERIDLQASF